MTELELLGLLVTLAMVSSSSSPPPPLGWRERIVAAARAYLDTPYQWGGGHAGKSWGVDCSGLVIRAARDAGVELPPFVPTSTSWWMHLPHVVQPAIGDLAFYGRPTTHASHVVMVTSFDPSTGIAEIIGANHGDPSCTTVERARELGAKVEEAPTHLFRHDFLGFATLAS